MAIDRIDWHADSTEQYDLPYENAGTHIGMFLAWVINHHLEGELHIEESLEELAQVRERKMTGREFLIKICDEKFWEEDLNGEGLAFVKFYYEAEGYRYYVDYEETLAQNLPSIYHVEDTWENYDLIAAKITAAYQQWKTKN